MSERLTPERLQLKWHLGLACTGEIAQAIAAAEERGRRSGYGQGVESAAQWLKVTEPLRLAMHRALSGLAPVGESGSSAPMSPPIEKHAHSAKCGGQPAGSGCICGVGFGAPRDSAPQPEVIGTEADTDGLADDPWAPRDSGKEQR